MGRPKIIIQQAKLKHNVEYLTHHLSERGLSLAAVTKVFGAYRPIVEVYDQVDGIRFLADSRLENIKKYPPTSQKSFMLLRLPMLAEVADVVTYTDVSLNSHLETIQALDREAQRQGKCHQIILMIDLGDLREGVFDAAELERIAAGIIQCQYIDWLGIGVNLTCYGGVLPTTEGLESLLTYQKHIEKRYGVSLEVVSGGNSSSLYLLEEGEEFPAGINQLRIGEAIVLGRETAFGKALAGMYQDVFTLSAPLIEYRDKPSVPVGPLGVNAFGERPSFVDKGVIRRGILALGRQDVDMHHLTPVDPRLEILGMSSDHMLVDFSACPNEYHLGANVEFTMSYGGLLAAFTSPYIQKEIN